MVHNKITELCLQCATSLRGTKNVERFTNSDDGVKEEKIMESKDYPEIYLTT